MKRLTKWMFNSENPNRALTIEGILCAVIILGVGFLVENPAPWIMLGLLCIVCFNLAAANSFKEK